MDIKLTTRMAVKDVAAICGLSVQAVYKWEKSERIPSEYVLTIAAATHYQVTPHELRPDIYPHPLDGLPRECDCAKVEV